MYDIILELEDMRVFFVFLDYEITFALPNFVHDFVIDSDREKLFNFTAFHNLPKTNLCQGESVFILSR